jgi:hypothetical protein
MPLSRVEVQTTRRFQPAPNVLKKQKKRPKIFCFLCGTSFLAAPPQQKDLTTSVIDFVFATN